MWCFVQKSLYESCRMGRRTDADSLICSLGHCECDGHTVHKLSQQRLTADWLALRENDCSQMHSKVSSDWLPSYIKATRPVLKILKMAGYFPDSPRKCPWGPASLLYNEYRVPLPGVKRPGKGVDYQPPISAEVKERIELYLYSPSGPSWSLLVWTHVGVL